jgi:RecA/RadA recombinase
MIFINQIREKVGIMFGNPETTAGKISAVYG